MEKIKCIIVSDIHGASSKLCEALRRNRDAEVVFFLGDGVREAEEVALSDRGTRHWLAVKGNCDFSSTFLGTELKKTEGINLLGKKIVYTHGDLYGVKYHGGGLRKLARDTGADIVLYGHTHVKREEYEDGVYYVNPGSLYGGESGRSCALLTIDGGNMLFSFLDL